MLGADELIDYKTQPLEDVIHDYDAAFDTVGGETYARSLSVNERWNNCFHVRAGKLGSHATIWRESNFPTHADKQGTIDEIGTMGG